METGGVGRNITGRGGEGRGGEGRGGEGRGGEGRGGGGGYCVEAINNKLFLLPFSSMTSMQVLTRY